MRFQALAAARDPALPSCRRGAGAKLPELCVVRGAARGVCPIPGAARHGDRTARLKSAVVRRRRSFQHSLHPGRVYVVRAELPGFKSTEQREVIVRPRPDSRACRSGWTSAASRRPSLVTGVRPPIDITTATIGSGARHRRAAEHFPVGRTFAQALYLTPGVSNSGTAGRTAPVDLGRHRP